MEYHIGRLSEEFGGALPSVILAERRRLPEGFLERLIEYRAYANTKAAKARRDNPKDKGEMWQLVEEIEFELAGEELTARE